MASADMIQEKLRREFPGVEDFSEENFVEVCQAMKEKILVDLNNDM